MGQVAYFSLGTVEQKDQEEMGKIIKKKWKQDMTVPFARARAKLGGSIR